MEEKHDYKNLKDLDYQPDQPQQPGQPQQLHKKWSFPLRISSVNMTKLHFPADLVTLTEEILNGKLHFLCSEQSGQSILPTRVKATKSRFNEIQSIITEAKKSGLVTKINKKRITLSDAKKLF